MTFPETDSDELESPFGTVTLLVDPGSIGISIGDKNLDLSHLKFVSAKFVSPEGKDMPISLGKANFPASTRNYLHSAFFCVVFNNKNYSPRGQFYIQLTTASGAKTFVISGKFSEHRRTQMINLYDALDHG
jgi:hypothetical protein